MRRSRQHSRAVWRTRTRQRHHEYGTQHASEATPSPWTPQHELQQEVGSLNWRIQRAACQKSRRFRLRNIQCSMRLEPTAYKLETISMGQTDELQRSKRNVGRRLYDGKQKHEKEERWRSKERATINHARNNRRKTDPKKGTIQSKLQRPERR